MTPRKGSIRVAVRIQWRLRLAVRTAQTGVSALQSTLADIHNLPVLTGEIGCQCLDSFELIDRIRAEYREKARELLLREPAAIPGWRASETSQRALSKDTGEVFTALSRADDSLTRERFVEACTVSLGAIRKLLAERNPQWNPDQVEREMNLSLRGLIRYEKIVRLIRSKERHHTLESRDGAFQLRETLRR
jgi:hypothetical protein